MMGGDPAGLTLAPYAHVAVARLDASVNIPETFT